MKYLAFDVRALSLMRICVAVVILLDLSVRITDLEAFYSNTGAVPLTMLFEHSWNDYFISLHAMSGLWQVQLILFIVAYVFAFMLLLGYRTQLFTVLSWFLMLSLHNRNSLILQGGDDLLRMVLFWGIFLPWGERYSCDSILRAGEKAEPSRYSVAMFAYLLQICYIYTGSALLKGPEWSRDYTAMYYVYGLDQITFPLTKQLFYYPELLEKLTAIAYYFELLVPALFFIPFKHSIFRTTGVLLIMLFHSINGFTLFIGMFPLIGIVTAVGLFPTSFMNWLENKFKSLRIKMAGLFKSLALHISQIIKPAVHSTKPEWFQNTRNAILVFLLVFVFDWNFSNLAFVNSKLSDTLRPVGYILRLDQNWGMFAPGVFKDDGWYVLEGLTDKSEKVNIFGKAQCDYKKPEHVVDDFKNDRWRKFMENMILSSHEFMRGYFCNYYKRIWNESNVDRKIKELRIIYMSEFTLPDYKYSNPEPEVLWECN